MDSSPLFYPRHTLYFSGYRLRNHVQAPRYWQCRNRIVYELALPPMGYQAFMESTCGPERHQTKLVFGHAVAHILCFFGYWPLFTFQFVLYHHIGLFLDGCFRLRYQRYRLRWLLYDWPHAEKTILLYWA